MIYLLILNIVKSDFNYREVIKRYDSFEQCYRSRETYKNKDQLSCEVRRR